MTANIRSRLLVDAVDLGVPESERTHPGAGSFSNRYGHATTDYGGPPNRRRPEDARAAGPGHWRDFANWASVALRAGPRHDGRNLALAVLLRTYRVGEPDGAPRPLRVLVEVDGARTPLGELEVRDDGAWHLRELTIPAAGRGREFAVVFDDGANVPSPEHHYGRSIAFVRVYGTGE